MWVYIIARLLQGLAGACASIASTAVVMAHSTDLTHDFGLTETATGLAYMSGPSIGAALFSAVGFKEMFLYR